MSKIWIDLLQQAKELIDDQNKDINQAAIRRAISNAYYAVFHLIVQDGTRLMLGLEQDDSEVFNYFQRSFEHGSMKAGGEDIRKNQLPERHNPISGPFPHELIELVFIFVELQKSRHRADYDYFANISKSIAVKNINSAKIAVENWNTVVVSNARASKQFVTLLLLQKMKRN